MTDETSEGIEQVRGVGPLTRDEWRGQDRRRKPRSLSARRRGVPVRHPPRHRPPRSGLVRCARHQARRSHPSDRRSAARPSASSSRPTACPAGTSSASTAPCATTPRSASTSASRCASAGPRTPTVSPCRRRMPPALSDEELLATRMYLAGRVVTPGDKVNVTILARGDRTSRSSRPSRWPGHGAARNDHPHPRSTSIALEGRAVERALRGHWRPRP